MSNHNFTHGYLVYGACVHGIDDGTFTDNYTDVVILLLNDYPSDFLQTYFIDASGIVMAMIWNSSDQEETVFFLGPEGNVI